MKTLNVAKENRTWRDQARLIVKPEGPLTKLTNELIAIREGDFRKRYFSRNFCLMLTIGGVMEQINGLVHTVNEEAEISKKSLEEIANQVTAIGSIIGPMLLKHINELRQNRMTLLSEVNQSLAAMKDIRKFFLDSDYKAEMERLERFVALCKEMNELKKAGVLDMISEIAIKLALKEGGDSK